MPQYCPLGTPSLLNGDFWENAARLKDFSWSVLLSSDPSNSLNSLNPNKTEQSSIGSEVVHFVKVHSTEVFQAFSTLLAIVLYAAIYSLVCYKCISWMKINVTRNFAVSITTITTVVLTSYTAFFIFQRTVPDKTSALILTCYFHIFVPCGILLCKFSHLQPSTKKYTNFGRNALRVICIIIAILTFFFTPSIPHEHGKCPDESRRALSEMFFWMTFVYILYSYLTASYMISNYQANVFYIYENVDKIKRVGEWRKKEGFGWIKHCYEPVDSLIVSKA